MKEAEAHHVEFWAVLFNKHPPQSFPVRANPEPNTVGFPFLSDAPTSTQWVSRHLSLFYRGIGIGCVWPMAESLSPSSHVTTVGFYTQRVNITSTFLTTKCVRRIPLSPSSVTM
jgi:hypothetical protein